jgi:hypothetical protein
MKVYDRINSCYLGTVLISFDIPSHLVKAITNFFQTRIQINVNGSVRTSLTEKRTLTRRPTITNTI